MQINICTRFKACGMNPLPFGVRNIQHAPHPSMLISFEVNYIHLMVTLIMHGGHIGFTLIIYRCAIVHELWPFPSLSRGGHLGYCKTPNLPKNSTSRLLKSSTPGQQTNEKTFVLSIIPGSAKFSHLANRLQVCVLQ